MYKTQIDENYITRNLLSSKGMNKRETSLKEGYLLGCEGVTYRQISLFDDMHFAGASLDGNKVLSLRGGLEIAGL